MDAQPQTLVDIQTQVTDPSLFCQNVQYVWIVVAVLHGLVSESL